MEGEHGFSQGIVLHFDICPLDAVSKPPPDGFEESLFGCEPDGKTLRGPGPLPTTDDLFLCKDPTKKEISPAGHQALDPTNIHNINACSNDHIKISEFGMRISE